MKQFKNMSAICKFLKVYATKVSKVRNGYIGFKVTERAKLQKYCGFSEEEMASMSDSQLVNRCLGKKGAGRPTKKAAAKTPDDARKKRLAREIRICKYELDLLVITHNAAKAKLLDRLLALNAAGGE